MRATSSSPPRTSAGVLKRPSESNREVTPSNRRRMSAVSDALNVNQSNFRAEVLQSPSPVLVDFWAPWCGPCRMVAPVVEKVAQSFQGRLKVVKLNTDDNPSLAGQYEVSGIPCLILFKNGEPVDRIVGYVPEKQLVGMVEKHLAPAA